MSGEKKGEKGKRGNWSIRAFFLLLAVSFVVHLVVGTRAYYQFGFSSDGFHYYSALRNSADGYGVWEGPVYEHLLGNHAYLTLFSLAPLVKLFGSPLVLLYVGVVSWHVSALAVFLVARYLASQFDQARSNVPAVLGVAYLAYPLFIEGASGFEIFLFQPDSFLAAGLALLAYGYLKRERVLFWLAMVFVLWTKEEYLPLVPVVLAWLAATSWYLFGKDRFSRKDWGLTAAVYLATAAVSLGAFFHYRDHNTIIHVPSQLHFSSLIHPGAYVHLAIIGLLLVLPVLPFLVAYWRAVAGKNGRGPLAEEGAKTSGGREDNVPRPLASAVYLAASLLVFVGGRLIGDMIIYGRVPAMHGHQAWSHTVLAPMLFLLLAVVFAPGLEGPKGRRGADLRWPLVASLGLSFLVSLLWMAGFMDHYRTFPVPQTWPVHADQLTEIRKHVPQATRYEVILLPEYHLYPFMDRSHVTYEWWHGRTAKQQDEVALQVNWAVLPKADATQDDLRRLQQTHAIVFETKDYQLLRRFGPQIER